MPPPPLRPNFRKVRGAFKNFKKRKGGYYTNFRFLPKEGGYLKGEGGI